MKNPAEQGNNLSFRQPELDLLRALAVLLVLGRHLEIIPPTVPALTRTAAFTWRNTGWIGVDLFFVLSGFLISGLFFKEYHRTGTVKPGRFLIRRGFKIYPAFYFFLTAATWPLYHMMNRTVSIRSLWGELLFLQNYVGLAWIHTWTLAIEEHFYLLLSIIIYLRFRVMKRPSFNFLPVFVISVALLLLGSRVWLAYQALRPWNKVFLPSHLRIDTLLFGVLISYFYTFHSLSFKQFAEKYRILLLVFCLAVTAPLPFYEVARTPFLYSIYPSILAWAFGGLLVFCLSLSGETIEIISKRCGFLLVIGRHSYSIYLWHVAVYMVTLKMISRWSADWFLPHTFIYVVSALGFGILMSSLIEQPFLRLRDRVCPRGY